MVALSAQLYADARLQQTVSPQVVLQSQILQLSAHDLRERVQAELDENQALEMLEDVDYLPAPDICATPLGDYSGTLDAFHAPQTSLPDAAVDWDGDDLRVRVVQSWSRNLQVDAAWARLDGQMR